MQSTLNESTRASFRWVERLSDSLDSSISKGTGTPVGNGLREREAEDLISKFMQNRKICCFEISEVNPTLDKENLMAEIAFNILQRSVNVLMMN